MQNKQILKTEVCELKRGSSKWKTQVQDLKTGEHEVRACNLILRQAILELIDELAKKVFGDDEKPRYARLEDIKKHVASERDPTIRASLDKRLKYVMKEIGWTSTFEESKRCVKAKFHLNSFAHPTLNSQSLHWAKFKFQTRCQG